jgi:hypothetical protein
MGELVKVKDILYYARIIPTVGIFDVCQLTIRTVKEDYFVGCDKVDKHAYLFSYSDLGEIVFHDRKQALDKVLVAENNKKKINNEVFYEGY